MPVGEHLQQTFATVLLKKVVEAVFSGVAEFKGIASFVKCSLQGTARRGDGFRCVGKCAHSRHLIIENSFVQEPLNLDRLVFELQVDGYRPILAHPERYFYYYENLDRYRALHDAGVEFQINLLSLAGYYGKGERRIAEKLIDMGLVDFVGTDLHGRRHVESIRGYMATREFRRHRSALEKVIKNGLIPDN